PPGRAHHRPAPRRCAGAHHRPRPAGGPGTHGGGDRAPSRRDQAGGLDHRHGTGGGPARGHGRGTGNPGAGRGGAGVPHRSLPEGRARRPAGRRRVTRRQAILALWATCLIWGVAFPLTKLVLADASPMAFTAARFLVAALLVAPALRGVSREEWRAGARLGAPL